VFEAPKEEYFPHLSLFYGSPGPDVISKIREAVQVVCHCFFSIAHFVFLKANHLENTTFDVDTLDVYWNGGTVDNWKLVKSVPLKRD
jgi:hypothetical protein